ncbi:MAG: hypothetical protein F6K31_02615 [Symploca sp. SIO2G7]|nr:hypothetical protein [Symploca sp. SIO2G7]
MNNLKNLYPQLKAWFPPEAHKLRKLPGGGTWYYVPWQIMRDRLDEIYPDWEIDYTDPIQRGEQVIVKCHLTIAGVTRVGFGNSHTEFENWEDEKKQRGTPEERAIACAFKRAMEQFGICRYLDIQTGQEKHTEQEKAQLRDFIKYMGRRNPSDRRDNQDPGAYNLAYRNGWIKDAQGNPAKNSHKKSQASKPKPVSNSNVVSLVSGSYPEHNRLVKAIRKITGHQPDVIVAWCQSKGVKQPSELPPEKAYQLLTSLVAGWLQSAKGLTESGAIKTLHAKIDHLVGNQGINYLEAVAIALDELQQLSPKEVRN